MWGQSSPLGRAKNRHLVEQDSLVDEVDGQRDDEGEEEDEEEEPEETAWGRFNESVLYIIYGQIFILVQLLKLCPIISDNYLFYCNGHNCLLLRQ
jgi:hypothetical protein